MVDADTVFEPETARRAWSSPFADPSVGAVAGNTKVGNRRGLLGRWQHIEYVIGFNLDRRLYDVLDCMPTVPGRGRGVPPRPLSSRSEGSQRDTLAEDTDLTIALGRAGWPSSTPRTRGPTPRRPPRSAACGASATAGRTGRCSRCGSTAARCLRRSAGSIGRLGLPYLVLFQIALPLLAPLIDVFALYGLLFLEPVPVIAFWVGFNVLLLALGFYAFRLDGERIRALWALPLQQFVYRQLMYLVVIQSIASALQGLRLRWQHVERSGDVEVAA